MANIRRRLAYTQLLEKRCKVLGLSKESKANLSKITFVLLNYKRPDNLIKHIIPSLLKNEIIDKIIVSHGLADTCFDTFFHNDKLLQYKHFKEQNDSGLICRFLAAQKAKTECIAFQDDDFLVNNDSIKFCYEKWLLDKHCIHGRIGRNMTENSYSAEDVYLKNVPMVLPGMCCMTSNLIVNKVNELAPIVTPYVQDCSPIWNGDDIFLNVVAMLHTKKFNKRHDYKFQSLPAPNAISERAGHYEHRTYFVTKLFKLFPELKQIFKLNC